MGAGPIIEIVEYAPTHRAAFRDLNLAWIEAYFDVEAEDRKALDDPEGNILDRGGHIVMALMDGAVVGTCALIRMNDLRYDYELAKMAVAPAAQGLGIGRSLAEACIRKAQSLGARNVYLESNTVLKAAIALYRNLGFTRIHDHPSPYRRSNIQMALQLSERSDG